MDQVMDRATDQVMDRAMDQVMDRATDQEHYPRPLDQPRLCLDSYLHFRLFGISTVMYVPQW